MELIGKQAVLTLDQRAQLVQDENLPGLKTLYVRPRPNWPDANGNYPLVPMDVEITISQKIGAVWSRDTVALPATGFSMEVQGEGLAVEAYYSTKRGLGAGSYISYQIECGVVLGKAAKAPSKFTWDMDYNTAWNITYPVAPTYGVIPAYSKKFRCAASVLGLLILYSPDPTTGTLEYYDLELCDEWVFFSPEKYYWRLWSIQPIHVFGSQYVPMSVEFA